MTALVLSCVCSGDQSTASYYKLHTDKHTRLTLTTYSLKDNYYIWGNSVSCSVKMTINLYQLVNWRGLLTVKVSKWQQCSLADNSTVCPQSGHGQFRRRQLSRQTALTCSDFSHRATSCESHINSQTLHASPASKFVSDIAIFVLKRDVKLQLTNLHQN